MAMAMSLFYPMPSRERYVRRSPEMLSQDDAEEERDEFEGVGHAMGSKSKQIVKKKLRYCAGIAEW